MQKPQYAILRFAKYKGPEIGQIEAHNERKKEKYASNPDIDTSRPHPEEQRSGGGNPGDSQPRVFQGQEAG